MSANIFQKFGSHLIIVGARRKFQTENPPFECTAIICRLLDSNNPTIWSKLLDLSQASVISLPTSYLTLQSCSYSSRSFLHFDTYIKLNRTKWSPRRPGARDFGTPARADVHYEINHHGFHITKDSISCIKSKATLINTYYTQLLSRNPRSSIQRDGQVFN
jgi:hypothetical protein